MQANSSPSSNITKCKSKYENQAEFVKKSGWFSPTLENVLCRMMHCGNISALTSTTTGVYIFTHKHLQSKKYVAMSRTAYYDLIQMFHRLYDIKDERLNALEWEMKYNSPNASQWMVRIYSVSNAQMLEVEGNLVIISNNALQPAGLNKEVKFTSKDSFYSFAEVYAKKQRESTSKCAHPVGVGVVE